MSSNNPIDPVAAELRQRDLVCEVMSFGTEKSEREWALVRYVHQMRQDWLEDHLPFHRALMKVAYDAKTLKQAQEWAHNALSRIPEKVNE